MHRLLCALLVFSLFASGCTTKPPVKRPDPFAGQLEADERITLRIPAQLLHGHDMEEPSYEAPEGYRTIPTYRGELAFTDRRLLFVQWPTKNRSSWLSIPYSAVARARPSRTPLLHYLVVWDTNGHPDSFVVDGSNVGVLHRHFAQAIATRATGSGRPSTHELPGD